MHSPNPVVLAIGFRDVSAGAHLRRRCAQVARGNSSERRFRSLLSAIPFANAQRVPQGLNLRVCLAVRSLRTSSLGAATARTAGSIWALVRRLASKLATDNGG